MLDLAMQTALIMLWVQMSSDCTEVIPLLMVFALCTRTWYCRWKTAISCCSLISVWSKRAWSQLVSIRYETPRQNVVQQPRNNFQWSYTLLLCLLRTFPMRVSCKSRFLCVHLFSVIWHLSCPSINSWIRHINTVICTVRCLFCQVCNTLLRVLISHAYQLKIASCIVIRSCLSLIKSYAIWALVQAVA